jgi:hypothetical protein
LEKLRSQAADMANPISNDPLSAAVRDQHDLLFQAWHCVLGEARITYVSGPITTGARWVDSVVGGRAATARPAVIEANNQQLHAAAAQLRTEPGRIVIEPASFAMPSWSQSDYLILWTDLIERHAGEVRFLPDWALSNGCAHEFERAQRHGIPTLSLDGQAISREEGLVALTDAHALLTTQSENWPALASLRDAIGGVVSRLC